MWINIRRDHDTVNLNDFQAGYDLTKTLIKRGHEHITYVCRGHEVTPRHYSKEERFAGYAKAMEEARLEVSTLFRIPDLEAYEDYVRKHRHVSAYVCYGREYQSLGYYLMRNGMKIPDEVEFGIFAENNYSVYPGCVALAQLPFEEVGKTAVEILLQKIEHPERRFPEKRIPFPIYTGDRLRY
ncbi:MAG: LacI family transcriptional regulator [Lentisphaerae bacterium]|nr:MAG: LacI family transcriptional regulator [Lentisphaerota bacterium]